MIGCLLQLLTTGSKRHKLGVLLRTKERKEGVKIKKSTISLQKCFCVTGERGRKGQVDPPITTRD